MAGTLINLVADTWTEIATNDASIYHKSGNGTVAYVEALSIPTGYDDSTPTMQTTRKSEGFPVSRLDTAVYAYAIGESASITVTPAGA